MREGKRMEENKVSKIKFIRNIIITLIALAIVAVIFYKAPDYILVKDGDPNETTLIINNKNLTSSERLKNDVKIENDIVYLSKEDISSFFDKYLYYDSKYKHYITTSGDKEAVIKVGEKVATINGISSNIKGTIIERDGKTYFPISEMESIYNIEVKKVDNANTVIIESLDREKIEANITKKISVKTKAKTLSRTVARIEKDSKVIVISETENGWSKIRTEDGKIGYIESKYITNKNQVRKAVEEKKNDEKISMVWDYYSEYVPVPKRQGTKIDGINVISPSFFTLEKSGQGKILDKAGNDGQQYVQWAKQNGYKVWALVGNDSMKETTSEILNDYQLRENAIEGILQLVDQYKLDGINIDFENMNKDDKDMFSRFIIELYPRLKEKGIILSVDVTAPDGGETWSLCFDRATISNNTDYIVFMGYDQNSTGSKKAGPVAGFNWVKTNLDKFLGQEEVSKEKLILAIPFYSRLWPEDTEGNVITSQIQIVNMKDINTAIPKNVERTWDEVTRQYYAQYIEGGKTKKIWLEELNSIKEKLNLAKDYDLPGVAFWSLDRQDNQVWKAVNEIILNK